MYAVTLAILPILASLAPPATAARLPSLGRRHPAAAAHAEIDLERIRRDATLAMQRSEGLAGRAPAPKKRLVRKRREGSSCGGSSSGNSTETYTSASYSTATDSYSASATDSYSSSATDSYSYSVTDSESTSTSSADVTTETASSSAIGDSNWASGGTKGASSSSTDSWTAATSSSVTDSNSYTASATTTSSSSAASASSTSSSDWYLVDTISGSNFFDAEYWTFWNYADPTNGEVTYVDSDTAWANGLVEINSAGHAIMKVDTTETVTTGRNSVRIHNTRIWTGGMVIMDAYHIPTGCGTWPAWWQNGPNWPEGGEIDIVEGVNEFTQNQVSLHTGVGCTMPSDLNSNQLGTLTTGSWNSYDCSSTDTSNQGCGVRDETSDNSYGSSFNSISGGVYAMAWDLAGIKVWFFPRSSIPSDITNDAPEPSGWGTPVADFPATDCSPYEFFYDHFNIFDTTLCGDWAGADGVWSYAGYAGQDQSCAALTGYSTCTDYVLNSGSSFSEAYWEVSYVKYFNSTSEV